MKHIWNIDPVGSPLDDLTEGARTVDHTWIHEPLVMVWSSEHGDISRIREQPKRRTTLIKMTFEKQEVIRKLRENLAEHRNIFEEAVEGYRKEALEQLNDAVKRLREGEGPVQVKVYLTAPENHEGDYKAVLSMLETSTDAEVVFDDDQYRCYMLDEWDWQRHFLSSTAAYSMTATEKLTRQS